MNTVLSCQTFANRRVVTKSAVNPAGINSYLLTDSDLDQWQGLSLSYVSDRVELYMATASGPIVYGITIASTSDHVYLTQGNGAHAPSLSGSVAV